MMEYRELLLTSTSYHQTVVYQQRWLSFICGYSLWTSPYVVSELELTPPATMRKLWKMPEPRDSHVAEIFEDEVVILAKMMMVHDALRMVQEFNLKTNECKEISILPRPWQKGQDGGETSESVLKFDVKKNECKEIPPLPRPWERWQPFVGETK